MKGLQYMASLILNIEIVMTYKFNRPAFPATRMRRIRKNDKLRAMVRETQLTADHLIYPVFVFVFTCCSSRSFIRIRPAQWYGMEND